MPIHRNEVASSDCLKRAEDLSFEYKYDILSEKTLNCAVVRIHAVYVRNSGRYKSTRRIEQWLIVARVLTLGNRAMSVKLITVTMLWGMMTSVVASEALFENSDFEAGTWKNWTVEGEAFERGPTTGEVVPESDTTGSVAKMLSANWKDTPDLYRQPELDGFEGRTFANSYHPEKLDKATGTLVSESFVIRNDYICFLLASGKEPRAGALAVNLVIDGRAVRQATPKGEDFETCCFHVRQLRGKEARIEIADKAILLGGWIAVDSIRGQEKPSSDWVVREEDRIVRRISLARNFYCNKRYLNIPAAGAFPEDALKLIVDGRVVQEICMAVADGQPAEFWQFIDLSLWQGKEATLTIDGWSSSDEPLSGVFLDDRIRGLDNLYNERYRPQFHCTPIQGWSNDINGAVYYDGEYHVFYQYDPSRSGAIGRNMHWGHAVSVDLFHWKHLPIALGVDPARGQNYSGSTVVDFNNSAGLQKGDEKTLMAFYTRRKPMTFVKWDYDVDRSDQCIAYSNDRGRTWTHLEKPAVASITAKNRDPKVFWHQASGKWIMAFFMSYCQMLWMRFSRLTELRGNLRTMRNRFAGCFYLFISPTSKARFRQASTVSRTPYLASAGG
jgi:fructan beta-fructosidase